MEYGVFTGALVGLFSFIFIGIPAHPLHDLAYVGSHLCFYDVLIALVFKVGKVVVIIKSPVSTNPFEQPLFGEGCLKPFEKIEEFKITVVGSLLQRKAYKFFCPGYDADLFFIGGPPVVFWVVSHVSAASGGRSASVSRQTFSLGAIPPQIDRYA